MSASVNQDEITPAGAAEMLEAGAARIIDVRQDYEWEAGRVAGAIHIPLDALPTRAEEVPREGPVIFICRSGVRSAMAAAVMRSAGVEAINLAGGIDAWVAQGLPLEPADGIVAKPRPDNS